METEILRGAKVRVTTQAATIGGKTTPIADIAGASFVEADHRITLVPKILLIAGPIVGAALYLATLSFTIAMIAGVAVMALFGAKPGDLPMQVIVFIMVVIYCVAAMQSAGGMEYLVSLTDRLLRRHPKYLTILAPFVTYMLTFMASTGQVSFATMPVIVDVAKEYNIRPTRA